MIYRAAAAAAADDDDDDDNDGNITDDSQTLDVVGLRYPADTGAYKCVAENSAGSSQDIATVFVQQQQTERASSTTGTPLPPPLPPQLPPPPALALGATTAACVMSLQ